MTIKNTTAIRLDSLTPEGNGVPILSWTNGVPVEEEAMEQLKNITTLPFIYKHIAVMPDVHVGKGSTIGSVIPTLGAIIPAAVGVDIGCGMMAVKTTLFANDLPDNLGPLRSAIEAAIPHGRSNNLAIRNKRDVGSWGSPPAFINNGWEKLSDEFAVITAKTPHLAKTNHRTHLGTLGTGNHFIEICLDENNAVWFMLHSGSRGVGNAIGNHFINLAKEEMILQGIQLMDQDLSYLKEGSVHYDNYVEAVGWAQRFASENRAIMMSVLIATVRKVIGKEFQCVSEAINCHHNYVQKEKHFGNEVLITRKGAVSAKKGQLGIIPGSMGAKSFIVRGKGCDDSFHSCSHGAGRKMSRAAAKRKYTLEDQIKATEGVECRKDLDVIDEIPMAYKDIEAVMDAQKELVDIVATLKQILCVKG